jgi:hypothetical protein
MPGEGGLNQGFFQCTKACLGHAGPVTELDEIMLAELHQAALRYSCDQQQ